MRPDRYTPMGQACLLLGLTAITVALALLVGDTARLFGAGAIALAGLGTVVLGLGFLRRSDRLREASFREGLAVIETIGDERLRDALHASLAVQLTGVRISMAELTKLADSDTGAASPATITVIGAHSQARKR